MKRKILAYSLIAIGILILFIQFGIWSKMLSEPNPSGDDALIVHILYVFKMFIFILCPFLWNFAGEIFNKKYERSTK